ncbi:GNAT family N-acetyltransferase [Alteribacter natronophilus]|uniref:GNAT family N-acetyltransferase n=1 Tax=Alteribacter natronophilus TaxID=2583810 RepID=UPI00110F437E|nr:GNAT family N-acetyltransferase [Alteribacter natronophilus]TMW70330.1 GNAT family N-acetyltransferase [Alteribacter natronophilus]
MTIMRLTEEHAEKLRRLRLEALKTNPESFSSSYEEEKHYTVEKYRRRLASSTAVTLGYFHNAHQLAGMVSVVENEKLKMRHRADVFGMYVSPDVRGRGAGRNLLEEAIGTALRLREVEQLHLAVVKTNTPAVKLYRSLGFQEYGLEERALRVNGTYYDELLMVLSL